MQAKPGFLHSIWGRFGVCENQVIPDTLRCTHPNAKNPQVPDLT